MEDVWGLRLARCPTEKGLRAMYAAAAHHCIVSDASHRIVVEVAAGDGLVQAMASVLLAPGAGFPEGVVAGDLAHAGVLHHPGLWPRGAVGPVKVLFPPGGGRCWLWVHAACLAEAVALLTTELEGLAVRDLSREVATFEVRGRLASQVLVDALPAAPHAPPRAPHRANEVYERAGRIAGPPPLPAGSALGVDLLDPRSVARPYLSKGVPAPAADAARAWAGVEEGGGSSEGAEGRASLAGEAVTADEVLEMQGFGCMDRASLLTDPGRAGSTHARLSDKALQEARSGLLGRHALVPRVGLAAVVIVDPGQPGTGFGAGWDVVVPAAWASDVLQALVLCGGRPGGFENVDRLLLEQGRPAFPRDWVDTAAGREWHARRHAKDLEADLRRPAGRKKGVPEVPPWLRAASEPGSVVVARSREALAAAVQAEAGSDEDDLEVLVTVTVECLRGGLVTENASILEPLEQDDLTGKVSVPTGRKQRRNRLERNVIGHVTSGDLSHQRGKGWGLATVSAESLAHLKDETALLCDPKRSVLFPVRLKAILE